MAKQTELEVIQQEVIKLKEQLRVEQQLTEALWGYVQLLRSEKKERTDERNTND